MAKLEVLKESNSLCHAYVSINLEAHVSYRISRIDVPNYIFGDDVQTRRLYAIYLNMNEC